MFSLSRELFLHVLLNFRVFEDFPDIFLFLISSFILLWSENILKWVLFWNYWFILWPWIRSFSVNVHVYLRKTYILLSINVINFWTPKKIDNELLNVGWLMFLGLLWPYLFSASFFHHLLRQELWSPQICNSLTGLHSCWPTSNL